MVSKLHDVTPDTLSTLFNELTGFTNRLCVMLNDSRYADVIKKEHLEEFDAQKINIQRLNEAQEGLGNVLRIRMYTDSAPALPSDMDIGFVDTGKIPASAVQIFELAVGGLDLVLENARPFLRLDQMAALYRNICDVPGRLAIDPEERRSLLAAAGAKRLLDIIPSKAGIP